MKSQLLSISDFVSGLEVRGLPGSPLPWLNFLPDSKTALSPPKSEGFNRSAILALSIVVSTGAVTFAMTTDAKRNQVVHHVATELAPAFYVMDLQAFHGTALLAPPTISFEHACPDDCVLFRIQFESRSFLA